MMKHLFVNVIKVFGLLFCGFAFLAPLARGEDATVTIYNHGSNLTTGLPGTNHGIYWGCIYDGDVRLNCFREKGVFSRIRNNRFAVFHLSPGVHVFSASYGKQPAKRSQLPMLLDSGGHYYLRAQSELRGVTEVEFEFGRLDNISCEEARKDTEKAKPLPDGVFSQKGRAALVAVQSIPPCP